MRIRIHNTDPDQYLMYPDDKKLMSIEVFTTTIYTLKMNKKSLMPQTQNNF